MAAGLNTRPKPDRGPGVAHPFGDDYAIFDNQSGVSFVRDASLLRNIRPLPHPVEIGGVKDDPDPLRADYDGDLGDFGRVYLVPNAVAQILAQVTCQDRKYPVRLWRQKSQHPRCWHPKVAFHRAMKSQPKARLHRAM
jgi:hypothetical protein